MAERILFPAYRDQLAPTLYPFGDGATLVDSRGGKLLERDMFLDASLYPVGNSGYLYLSKVEVAARLITFSIAQETRVVLATASFDPVFPGEIVSFSDGYGRPAGIIVSEPDRLSRFGAWPQGTYNFEPEKTIFAPTCIIPVPPPGVQGILLADGTLLEGDVWLVGDNGVAVREEEGDIRIDIVGDPLFVRKLCGAADLFNSPRLLRTINGCGPDPFGNFNFAPTNLEANRPAIRIAPGVNGELVFSLAGANTGGSCGT